MTEIKNGTNIGQIQIADDVIAVIAGTAALEVDGVVNPASNITGDLVEKFGRKNLSKGVKVEISEGKVNVNISISVRFGCKVSEIAAEVQEKIKTAIEMMTGLLVKEINVNVSGVLIEKQKVSKNNHE